MGDEIKEEIDLSDFFETLKSKKKIFFFIVPTAFIAGILLFIFTEDTFRSKAVLFPEANSTSPSIPSEIGGLASIAGIEVPQSAQQNKTKYCQQLLISSDFFTTSIIDVDLIEDLFDEKTAKKYYELNGSEKAKLTEKLHLEFLKRFNVNFEEKDNFFELSYKSSDPETAQRVLTKIILMINKAIRNNDVVEAKKSLEFLEEKISVTQNLQTQLVLSKLISEAISTIAIAEAKEEYYLKTIDSPKQSFKTLKPNFLIYGFGFAFVALMLGVFWALITVPIKR